MTLNADTERIALSWKGTDEARTELDGLKTLTDSFNPVQEIQGRVQLALDQITLQTGGIGDFKPTGLRVGTQEQITRWEANPKIRVNHPDDFLADINQYASTHPESHADLHALADRINQWFRDNPPVSEMAPV